MKKYFLCLSLLICSTASATPKWDDFAVCSAVSEYTGEGVSGSFGTSLIPISYKLEVPTFKQGNGVLEINSKEGPLANISLRVFVYANTDKTIGSCINVEKPFPAPGQPLAAGQELGCWTEQKTLQTLPNGKIRLISFLPHTFKAKGERKSITVTCSIDGQP